jgi:hypothetical protein
MMRRADDLSPPHAKSPPGAEKFFSMNFGTPRQILFNSAIYEEVIPTVGASPD